MTASTPGRVYLIRHGQTPWTITGQHTSVTDIPLTAVGEEEAKAIGVALAHVTFELALVSPRQRTQRTAELAGLGQQAVI